MKIVVLDGYGLNPGDLSWERLEALGEVIIYDRTLKTEIVARCMDAEIILTNKTKLTANHFEQLPKLKYIGVLATGYNIVDVEAASSKGIIVTNVPAYGTKAVAQFVFAHLLEICHHISEHAQSVREGQWNRAEDFCYWNKPLIELDGRTMGIIGTGKIGVETAKIAQAFGMRVIAYAPRPNLALESHGFKYVAFDALLSESDVISLHCPLNDATRGLIDAAAFDKMKSGVILINTSRGPLVDEAALEQAIQSGKVYAAGLDVLTVEPPVEPLALYRYPQCNITPHIAWAPQAARNRLLNIAVDNISAFLNGEAVNVIQNG